MIFRSLLATLLLLSLAPASLSAAPLEVWTSVVPLKHFIEQIGGTEVNARAIIRAGQNPHNYNPPPSQIQQLSSAALYFKSSSEFDRGWVGRIQATNPTLQMVDILQGFDPEPTHHHSEESHEERHEEGHGEEDPHLWTSPLMARKIAFNIYQNLSTVDPDHQAYYQRNYQSFDTDLEALHHEIEQLLKPIHSRSFMVFHPVWGYFAETYGLTQITIEMEGKSPGARSLANKIKQAKSAGLKVIFVQPQFNQRAAQQVASAIGGRVHSVDPLAADYIHNLRQFALQLARQP
ncbi:MAG: zinc ABC transporter solute-binding protein [Gammaproteobacteria bacterium]|jgi:zinc transport system substrate-binding protein|nr:zinc ABC transporter solute-binding protein [Gammaproteobacteria bacterium]MBT3488250.1 zinc ABC transporter solute-binding protein [Gammaproteobacteria bacterium]MBT3719921.1 zinc ABC transporter solute-binding protein [Gammaproteobacteria bacterium]MBT3843837.1 zinc ABC transporter solute-binding protein [Gammaproteobacteria bacterium]MBT3894231.1 zinc ABC transporter solute-binding protein [Gammaproteobacteria bacterium]